ncbi:MAG: hypothetical protein DME24_12190 [Verrucomicrobia bacterium]|nr:MAG: hypothetical protein DME24_12190 [Verrucomicrobiota bacterium]
MFRTFVLDRVLDHLQAEPFLLGNWFDKPCAGSWVAALRSSSCCKGLLPFLDWLGATNKLTQKSMRKPLPNKT